MWERKLCLHTALNRTFTISKVNLNLQYFCLIEIWKSEVQGWNLSKIFGILTSGFGHNKITSNEPWNTETQKTDRNPPITNQKRWPFEPFEVSFCFIRFPAKMIDVRPFFFWREEVPFQQNRNCFAFSSVCCTHVRHTRSPGITLTTWLMVSVDETVAKQDYWL